MDESRSGYQITVFVFNIPATMHWKGLWALFSFHGNVVDAFIPKKKSKSGKRFGFVRFSNFKDALRAISRLNGFVILGNKIWVKIARFKERRHIWRKVSPHGNTRVFKGKNKVGEEGENNRKDCDVMNVTWDKNTSGYRRNAVTGLRKGEQSKVVQDHIEDEHLWKLQKCLVVEVASFCETRTLEDRIVRMGLGEIRLKRIQGNYFLLEIPDVELLGILKQKDWSYLKDFFISITHWFEEFVFSERVTWIEVSGNCWNLGKCGFDGGNVTKTSNFEKMEMLISVGQMSKIEEVILLEVGNKRYPISVSEKGWSEDLNINMSNWESRQKEVEESVSESRSAIELDPENFSEEEAGGNSNVKSLDRASEDIVNMGLAIVLGPGGSAIGQGNIEEDIGFLNIVGLSGGKLLNSMVEQLSSFKSYVLDFRGRAFYKEIEDDLLNSIRSRKKKKQFNKKICSMREIQDKVLTSKEKQKRDKIRRNEKDKGVPRCDEKIVNLSLSDSDISNRRKVILRDAKQT
ncbi:hypothetical protein PVK06_030936 [Gossypium arboreum]|uniref:RRM domain-containing protein n=1 Tax=Gossypium arboreum TaxID=29729 RepID=A0ABR0NQM7_GOSAR|nr:hypothetical protein PVK06_030936 [Gossypium arboreum]